MPKKATTIPWARCVVAVMIALNTSRVYREPVPIINKGRTQR